MTIISEVIKEALKIILGTELCTHFYNAILTLAFQLYRLFHRFPTCQTAVVVLLELT